jgi:energy-coupling factor transport system ATP-binding protein
MLTNGTRRDNRWQPLRLSLWVAAAFVVGRLVFRIVFGGAAGDGPIMASFPRVELPGFFASVNLFGPVTLGGLSHTLLAAIPLATFIVASGLLFSLIDVRRLLMRTRAWGGGTASLSAVLIALAVLPELSVTARRLVRARRLRARRGGIRGVVAPLVGATVERASALAASLEGRGFLNTSRVAEPDCAAPIEADDVTLQLSDGRAILEGLTFLLTPGTLTLVTGATGSGKTTLLRALAGLFESFDRGVQTGHLRVGGVDRRGLSARATAAFVSYVPQDPRSSFASVNVAEEIGLALALRGDNRHTVDARVAVLARNMGVSHLLSRRVQELSAGEATLVALAAALISEPTVLLIDEPFADLDDIALDRVAGLLRTLALKTGITTVVAEHRITPLVSLAHARLHIAQGTIRSVDVPDHVNDTDGMREEDTVTPGRELAVSAIVGPNGSGKTTLLWGLALPGGKSAPNIRLVPDNPIDLFNRESVAEECRTNDARRNDALDELQTTQDIVEALLGSTIDLNAHPRDLSTGQQRALAIALQLQSKPEYLLIDEPTRGLDPRARLELAELLSRVSARGTRVLVATHDRAFVSLMNGRIIDMPAGPLAAAPDFFAAACAPRNASERPGVMAP